MQAFAAWLGAVLGVINLTFAVSSRRPPIFIRYKEVSGGRFGIVITMVAARTPILVKRLWVLPRRGRTQVMALVMARRCFAITWYGRKTVASTCWFRRTAQDRSRCRSTRVIFRAC